jgi:hypothetical protein
MELHTLIGHVSVYADDPNAAASTLSALIGGSVATFPPNKGGGVCFLSANRVGWEHEFIGCDRMLVLP